MDVDLTRICRLRAQRSELRQRALARARTRYAAASEAADGVADELDGASTTLNRIAPDAVNRVQGSAVAAKTMRELEGRHTQAREAIAELELVLEKATALKEDSERLVKIARSDYAAAQRAAARLDALAAISKPKHRERSQA